MNLNGLQNCIQINKKNLSGIANYKKNKTEIDCWEADHNFSWDRKKSVDRENNLIPRRIRETIHGLKNPNHINKIFYMLSEIWITAVFSYLSMPTPEILINESYANPSLCVRKALLPNYFN